MASEYRGFAAQMYDIVHSGPEGDIEFYLRMAKRYGPTVLDVGCGTGRTLLPLLEAGYDAYGLDLSPDMLEVANSKIDNLKGISNTSQRLIKGDMSRFSLDRSFNLIICTLFSFEELVEPEIQRAALRCIYEHLAPGGAFVVHLARPNAQRFAEFFDSPMVMQIVSEVTNPATSNTVLVFRGQSVNPYTQIVDWRHAFEEVDDTNKVVRKVYGTAQTRYTTRFEMSYLLELAGFSDLTLYGDFSNSPFEVLDTQIWVALK